MGALGSCVFKAGYKMYADTCIGRRIHERILHRLKSAHGDNALHSHISHFKYGDLVIQPIPILTTNYTYMIGDSKHKNFVLVDVGDPTLFIKIGYRPDAILTTHKHWDHSYGNAIMRNAFEDIPVYGGDRENVPGATETVKDGQKIKFGRLEFTAVLTPGHTKGHICYFLDGSELGAPACLFTGDHLMLAGCGANFEGNAKIMIDSLEKLKLFPDDTLIWPGHESALNNLLLVAFLEDDNQAVLVKLVWVFYQRLHKMGTCPSTLGEEKLYNPFLRTHDRDFIEKLGLGEVLDKWNIDDVGAAVFKEILNRASDVSQKSMDKKKNILTWVAEQIRFMRDIEICSFHSSSPVDMKCNCQFTMRPVETDHQGSSLNI